MKLIRMNLHSITVHVRDSDSINWFETLFLWESNFLYLYLYLSCNSMQWNKKKKCLLTWTEWTLFWEQLLEENAFWSSTAPSIINLTQLHQSQTHYSHFLNFFLFCVFWKLMTQNQDRVWIVCGGGISVSSIFAIHIRRKVDNLFTVGKTRATASPMGLT